MLLTSDAHKGAEQFGAVLEAAPIGMLVIEASGLITFVNTHIERLFGYDRSELIGTPLERLVPQRSRHNHAEFRTQFLRSPTARAMGMGRDLYGLRKDGSEVPIEIGLSPINTPHGTFVLSSIADISERKLAMQRLHQQSVELAATLKEREVLLQEIHHRVKNNLQIITSMINMQMRTLEEAHSREILNECKTRVDAIALIHEKLYQSRDFRNIPFAEYVSGLITTILQASGPRSERITAEAKIEAIMLPVSQAIPCGLIVNELVTNSMKHAFTEHAAGCITVSLERHSDRLVLQIRDDGIGMSEDAMNAQRGSIGLRLVASLADQLDGTFRWRSEGGFTATVEFPVEAGSS